MRIDGINAVGFVTSSGDVELTFSSGSVNDLTSTRITETSALSLKTNVQSLDSQIDNVLLLNPVSFNWKEDNREDIGLIAEEVKKIYPQLVKDDKEGNAIGINYSKLTAILIKAINELNKKLENYKK